MASTARPPTRASTGGGPLLQIRSASKRYGAVQALSDVDLDVRPGELHGLLGENGAGKSTLVRLMSGVERADSGSFSVAGEELPARHTPEMVARAGVAFIHQDLGLVGEMSIAENVALAVGYPTVCGFVDWRKVRSDARAALALLGLEREVDEPVETLPIADQAVVAIARALVQQARVVVLDEPTAALSETEARALFNILGRLVESGVGCLLITHRIQEVIDHCQRITVLRDGRVVAAGDACNLDRPTLVQMITGKGRDGQAGTSPVPPTAVAAAAVGSGLELRGIVGEVLAGVDLRHDPGSMLVVTGLADSGHHDLGSILGGLARAETGEVRLDGTPVSPSELLGSVEGIGYVSGDRGRFGGATELTIRENLFLNPLHRSRHLRRRRREEEALGRDMVRQFDLRPPNLDLPFSALSGGNAQKVCLARAVLRHPRLLVLDEPTLGVDVGAREEIYRILRDLAATSTLLVVISSDFDEVAKLGERTIVLSRGRVSAELRPGSLSLAAVTSAAFDDPTTGMVS